MPGLRPGAAHAHLRRRRDVRRELRLPLRPERLDGQAPPPQGTASGGARRARRRRHRARHREPTTRTLLQGYRTPGLHRVGYGPDHRQVAAVLPGRHHRHRGLLQRGLLRCPRRSSRQGRHVDRHVLRPGRPGRVRPAGRSRAWPPTACGTSSSPTCPPCCERPPTTRSVTSTSSTTRLHVVDRILRDAGLGAARRPLQQGERWHLRGHRTARRRPPAGRPGADRLVPPTGGARMQVTRPAAFEAFGASVRPAPRRPDRPGAHAA